MTGKARAACGFVVSALACLPVSEFTVDDAYILARYGLRLARAGEWAFNPGSPSDGVTGPLYVLPYACEALLGLTAGSLAKPLGVVCGAFAIALASARTKSVSWFIIPAISLVVFSYPLWLVGGLETGAAALALTMVRLAPHRLALLAAVSVPWLRPELVPCVLVLLLISPTPHASKKLGALFVLISAGVLAVARWLTFGSLVPLSAPAKLGGFGLEYGLLAMVVITSVIGLVLLAKASRLESCAGIVAACSIHLLVVVGVGGDWMPGFRLFVPMLPLYAFALAEVLDTITARRWLWVVGLLAIPIGNSVLQVPRVIGHSQRRASVDGLKAQLAEHPVVALVDVGYLVHDLDVSVLDLGGVTDPRVARLRGGHLDKQLDDGLLAHVGPSAIVLHAASHPRVSKEGGLETLPGAYPVELRLAKSRWVRRNFRATSVVKRAEGYYYVLLERRLNANALPRTRQGADG